MDLPRDSSDLQIALACQVCNGNGGIGTRRAVTGFSQGGSAGFEPCDSCAGTGWQIKKPAELTAMQLARLVQRLPQLATLPTSP